MDVVSTAGNATTIVDRNDHGARLHTPPSRVAGNGEKAPLVGLDATGRAELWRVVLGEEVQTTDIFDSDRERRRFLEDALDLRVIQAADMPRYYEGNPATKDTDGDAALLQAIAEEYSGIQAPRQRGVDRDELADADTGIVHECENCVVAFLKIVGTTAIDGGPEGVELTGLEPNTRLNFEISILAHV